MDFPAVLYLDTGMRLLENLWRHMLEGLPGAAADAQPPSSSP
jgi:hypothetical protein